MSETVYALYTCLKATRDFRDLDLDDAAQEIENLFKGWNAEVTVRGVYSTVCSGSSARAPTPCRTRPPRSAGRGPVASSR